MIKTDLIADLPLDDRPRERLLTHGASTLSSSELLALLLGSGVRGKNAIQLARELLQNGLGALAKRDVADLAGIYGVGPAKAARIAAAFELCGRRTPEEVIPEPPEYVPDVLGRALIGYWSHHSQERLGAAFLDTRHRMLKQREIYVGTINGALVSTRDVVRYALFDDAAAVVLYHNHPSGHPSPSSDDLTYTRKVKKTLELFDLELLDHLIIGTNKYYSFLQSGLMATAC
jgi:DNA repair protein RadC